MPMRTPMPAPMPMPMPYPNCPGGMNGSSHSYQEFNNPVRISIKAILCLIKVLYAGGSFFVNRLWRFQWPTSYNNRRHSALLRRSVLYQSEEWKRIPLPLQSTIQGLLKDFHFYMIIAYVIYNGLNLSVYPFTITSEFNCRIFAIIKSKKESEI